MKRDFQLPESKEIDMRKLLVYIHIYILAEITIVYEIRSQARSYLCRIELHVFVEL